MAIAEGFPILSVLHHHHTFLPSNSPPPPCTAVPHLLLPLHSWYSVYPFPLHITPVHSLTISPLSIHSMPKPSQCMPSVNVVVVWHQNKILYRVNWSSKQMPSTVGSFSLGDTREISKLATPIVRSNKRSRYSQAGYVQHTSINTGVLNPSTDALFILKKKKPPHPRCFTY